MDDGSESFEQSVAMLRAAREAGTTDIVATPHANNHYAFDPELISQRIAKLEAVPETLPRIHRGCDFHLSFVNIRAASEDPRKFTINHLNYLMVEFPDFNLPSNTECIFRRFLNSGVVPVITHPERNKEIMRDLPRLTRWIHQGCLVQVTASSLTGGFGRRFQGFGWDLIRRKMVHVVASDAHDPVRRHPRLDQARREVAKRTSESDAACLFEDNPRTIVDGRPSEEIASIEGMKRGWLSIFK